ncbi:Eco57I restriction-modification methylase domain-containing protein, partial [Helicobacter sp. T3_23-1059]
CIYGIDIDADTIAIARLRFWLSIAVDEVSPSPLPNLDFKFMQGNSLLESLSVGKECIEIIPRDFMREIPSTKLFDENADKIIFSHDIAKSLQNLFLDYYAQNDAHKKHTLKSQIKSIMSNAFEVRIAQIQKDIDSKTKELSTPNNDKTKKRLTNEIDSLLHQIPALQSLANDFITNDFHTDKVFLYNFFFANIINEGGFDIVIGNPPYIRQESIPNKQAILGAFGDFACSSADIYTYFFAKALDLLAPQGILTYIVSNKFTRAGYGKNLRSLLLCHTIESYTDFNGIKIFENAIVDSCILQVSKSAPQGNKIRYAKDLSSKNCDCIPQDSLNAQAFIFVDSRTLALKQKIEKIGTPLKEWNIKIYRGVLTGYNEAFIIDTATKDSILDLCDDNDTSRKPFYCHSEGATATEESKICHTDAPFCHTEGEARSISKNNQRDISFSTKTQYDKEINPPSLAEGARGWVNLTERERTEQIIKPILRGRDIKRYGYEWAGLWLIGTFPALKLDIEDYPALKKYLENFMPRIAQSGEKGCRKKTSNKWFETQDNIAYYEDFEKEKIVYPNMNKEFIAYYDTQNFYTNQKCFIVTSQSENLK